MTEEPEDFAKAFEEEFNDDPPTDDPSPTEDETPKEDETPATEDETPVETPPAEGGEETPKEDEPQFATKSDVIEAMREYNTETSQRVETVNKTRDEIIEKIHPEGIDTKLYDSNGNVIKTAQDIVDRGLEKDNGEPYTYEEAASWVLNAQQKMNKNIEELQGWAEGLAETNISLYEGNQRVMEVHGETLKLLPQETVKSIAEAYIKTLEFDKSGSYVTKMSLSPTEFYDLALAPYKELQSTMADKAKLEAEEKQRQAEAEQSERNGLPPQRGQAKTKSNTGDEMLDALIDEMDKED